MVWIDLSFMCIYSFTFIIFRHYVILLLQQLSLRHFEYIPLLNSSLDCVHHSRVYSYDFFTKIDCLIGYNTSWFCHDKNSREGQLCCFLCRTENQKLSWCRLCRYGNFQCRQWQKSCHRDDKWLYNIKPGLTVRYVYHLQCFIYRTYLHILSNANSTSMCQFLILQFSCMILDGNETYIHCVLLMSLLNYCPKPGYITMSPALDAWW